MGNGRSPEAQSLRDTNHELALLFVIFVFGAINDINDDADVTHYFEPNQAALNLNSLLHRCSLADLIPDGDLQRHAHVFPAFCRLRVTQ
jgi:hypothetical protein